MLQITTMENAKPLSKEEKERLMKEYYRKYAKLDAEIEEEWKYVSKEADEMLGEY